MEEPAPTDIKNISEKIESIAYFQFGNGELHQIATVEKGSDFTLMMKIPENEKSTHIQFTSKNGETFKIILKKPENIEKV